MDAQWNLGHLVNFKGTFKFWQVTLFTRGKAPITQQLPGESDKDFVDFSSKVCFHLGLKISISQYEMLSEFLVLVSVVSSLEK